MNLTQGSVPEAVDTIFLIITAISLVLLVAITAAMVYFVIRYRRSRHPVAVQIEGHTGLEITWTVIPTLIVMGMFYFGYEGFVLMRNVPDDALEIKVTARMWDWTFKYDNGITTKKLFVPVDRPIKLLLTSVDVLHSFYLPAFRVKEDAVPGRESYLWFRPQSIGPADIYCAEYCGQRHAYMLSQVIVMETGRFQAWYDSKADPSLRPIEAEALAVMDRHLCLDCHTVDASAAKTGNRLSLLEIFGRQTQVRRGEDQHLITADEAYIRRAIQVPSAEILDGHEDRMPVPVNLSEEDLELLVKYLRTRR